MQVDHASLRGPQTEAGNADSGFFASRVTSMRSLDDLEICSWPLQLGDETLRQRTEEKGADAAGDGLQKVATGLSLQGGDLRSGWIVRQIEIAHTITWSRLRPYSRGRWPLPSIL